MELKVWVEGIQRIVCGVTENTTCQDVVFALAHATGKSGRFTLIERWRSNERLLAPHEYPLKILAKWGEYSNDVQFILQWSDTNQKQPCTQLNVGKTKLLSLSTTASNSPTGSTICVESTEKSKPLNFSSGHQFGENVGVVKGVPQVKSTFAKNDFDSPEKCNNDVNVNNQNGIRREVPPYKDPPSPPMPPPYRDPPPPQSSSPANNHKLKKNLLMDFGRPLGVSTNEEPVFYNSQYKELVQLINYQREKLSNQQADITKYDAEIVFWESKGREQHNRMEFIAQELVRVSNISRMNNDKIKALSYIEEENEIVRQQEKTLKSEITLLRSKLANCETELLQCKNKIRLLMDDLQMEKRVQARLGESQLQLERSLLTEVERLQHELELANQNKDHNHMSAETLKREVSVLEAAIVEKKKEVETLVKDMKEANLRSLSIASAEEVRHLLEGPLKAGSTRKIIGSPRQLENAVPTNKNPHGVWV